jgi:hypothetical protein
MDLQAVWLSLPGQVPWSPWDPGHCQRRRSRWQVAYPHQDQLCRVDRGDEGTAPGAAHWKAVRYDDVDYYEDQRALDALIAAVSSEMQFSLFKKQTVKEDWDAIAAARIGSDHVQDHATGTSQGVGELGLQAR